MVRNNESMNQIYKITLCGLLLCPLGGADKGYGQEAGVMRC
jgi:hypothetical protein